MSESSPRRLKLRKRKTSNVEQEQQRILDSRSPERQIVKKLLNLSLVPFTNVRSESGLELAELYKFSEEEGSGSGELPERTQSIAVPLLFLDDVDGDPEESETTLLVVEEIRTKNASHATRLEKNSVSPPPIPASLAEVSRTFSHESNPANAESPPLTVIRVTNTSSQTFSTAPLLGKHFLPAFASVLIIGSVLLGVFVGRRRGEKEKLTAESVEENIERREEMVRSYVAERRESTENTFLLSEYLRSSTAASAKQDF